MAKAYAELVGQPPDKPAGQSGGEGLTHAVPSCHRRLTNARGGEGEARKNPLNLYWDMTHGDDANDGSSQDSPIRSSERLAQLYETHVGRALDIHLANWGQPVVIPERPGNEPTSVLGWECRRIVAPR